MLRQPLATANEAYTDVIMPMKVELALEGIERSSIRNDIGVIVRTARALLHGHDAREGSILIEAQRRIDALNRANEDA